MKKVGILFLGLLLVVGCTPPSGGHRTEMDVTSTTWDAKVLQAPGPVLVDFWRPGCPPCRMMEPQIKSLAREFTVYRVNGSEEGSLATEYQVYGYPTFLIFKDGKLVERLPGARPKGELRQALLDAGAQPRKPELASEPTQQAN